MVNVMPAEKPIRTHRDGESAHHGAVPIPQALLSCVQEQLGPSAQLEALFRRFLSTSDVDLLLVEQLCTLIKGGLTASWSTRRVACLMLENQILRLRTDQRSQINEVLSLCQIKKIGDSTIDRDVLAQGYNTTEPHKFFLQLQRRISQCAAKHQAVDGTNTSIEALRSFILASRCECKLTLARYLIPSQHVVDHVLAQLRIAGAVLITKPTSHPYYPEEADNYWQSLPRYERTIIQSLCPAGRSLWVAPHTGSKINSLLEYPIGTVVLALKLPGSDLEFEVKRCGLRGPKVLDVACRRNNMPVPPSHRIQGASMGHLLSWEAGCSAFLSRFYRLVHKQDAPISFPLRHQGITEVPASGGPASLIEYFSKRHVYGNGFAKMRQTMRAAVDAYRDEGYLGGKTDRDIACQFLAITQPGQILLARSSMYRLDLVARYLGKRGAKRYFGQHAKQAKASGHARWFADTLLTEVLGQYQPPRCHYTSHQHYIKRAFELDHNRQRANQVYLQLTYQLGFFWGTLLAARIYTRGESLVARNIGIKSRWRDGRWSVDLVFMDHDDVHIIGKRLQHFWPDRVMSGFWTDSRYIFGRPVSGRQVPGNLNLLRKIYRIAKNDPRGEVSMRQGMVKAYRQVEKKLASDSKVQALFLQAYVDEWATWDHLVRDYLKARVSGEAKKLWKRRTLLQLRKRGYGEALRKEYVDTIVLYEDELREIFFFLDPAYEKNSSADCATRVADDK